MKRTCAPAPRPEWTACGRGLRGAQWIAASHDRILRVSWIYKLPTPRLGQRLLLMVGPRVRCRHGVSAMLMFTQ